jgi:soluble lytic murein transglycosylase-like protein
MGRFLSQLCDPPIGIEIGCRHLGAYLKKYVDPFPTLEAWNGGPGAVGKNPTYAYEVLARLEHFNV